MLDFLEFLKLYWPYILLGIAVIIFALVLIFRKKRKGLITLKIYEARANLRKMDSLLLDLEKYFGKIENKMNSILNQ